MEIDTVADKEKLTKELTELQEKLKTLENQRANLMTAIVQRQGALGYLNDKEK